MTPLAFALLTPAPSVAAGAAPGDVMGVPLWAAGLGLAAAAVLILPGLAVLVTRRKPQVSEAAAEADGLDATSEILDRRTLRRARVRLPDEDPIIAAMGIEGRPPTVAADQHASRAARRRGRRRGGARA